MRTHSHTFGRPHERGAALVAALMFTLVLTGLGIVAMQSTVRSLQVAGNYRLRKQAQAASDGIAMYTTTRAGLRSHAYWERLKNQETNDRKNGIGGATGQSQENRAELMARGGYTILKADDFKLNSAGGMATGLFSDATGRSHESGVNGANFQVIMRDPIEGPKAPGYSGKFCFKKVFFVSRVTYGTNVNPDDDWDRPVASAMGQTGMEGLIGPIECGNN